MSFERITPLAQVLETAGIRYILSDKNVPASLSLMAEAVPAPRPSRPAPQRQPVRDMRHPIPPRPALQKPVQQIPASRPCRKFPFVSPDAWPENWRALLDRTRKCPVAWTYPELGLDLSGHASPDRRDCLNKLLHSLKRRAGTYTFWPYALPEGPESALTPRPDIFWSGLREIGARMLIIMGSTASNAIGLSGRDVRPLSSILANGCFICFTWDFAHIQKDTNRLDQISRYIDAISRQFGY